MIKTVGRPFKANWSGKRTVKLQSPMKTCLLFQRHSADLDCPGCLSELFFVHLSERLDESLRLQRSGGNLPILFFLVIDDHDG